MHYWYFPYSVHVAYPPVIRQVSAPLAITENMTAFPSKSTSYPPVNTTRFTNSAKHSLELFKQAELLVRKISESETFANELMTAAQRSDQKKVDEMSASVGITAKFEAKFIPEGFRIELQSGDKDGKVIVNLRW
ncbi:hypothetical protein [Sporosarcina highlanderae]|uniref:Amphi-Trp domain-containing protein n=1 Tax=Sporosarcina highlanderae TaxID=3035916 RepID=A0ABT8JUG0_9BACL|nr:hypothetical protein [Sporosarcina highlanderae]MDN4608497.1 hypothetical protein [Sporosarcina highlanderae]